MHAVSPQRRLHPSLYQEYLKHPRWRALAVLMHEIAEERCEACGQTDELEVHHLTYDRLGVESPQDLVVLCAGCHERAHTDALQANLAYIAERHPETFADYLMSPVHFGWWQSEEEAIYYEHHPIFRGEW